MSYVGQPPAVAPITETQAAAAIDARAVRKSGAQALTQTEIDQALANLALTTFLPLGYLTGLTLSRASATTFSIASGVARNEDAGTGRTLSLAATLTKSLSAWAVGNNNGGLDTGTVAVSSWYHVHLIRRDSDGLIDALYSLSATAPTMPVGWTARRRIGSINTDASSQITAFVQNGDVFTWDVPFISVSAVNPGTAAVSRTLSVPSGVVVFPIVAWHIQNATTATIQVLITPLSIADTAPAADRFTLSTTGVANSNSTVMVSNVPTNLFSQVRTRLSASGATDTLRAVTHGWIDPRGK